MDIDLSDEEYNEVDERSPMTKKIGLNNSYTVSSHELRRTVRPKIPSHWLEKQGF